MAFLAIAFLFRNPILVFIGQIIERIDPGGGSPSLVGPRPLDVLQVVVSNEPDAALRRQWQEAIRRGRAPVRADRTIERSAPHNDDTANLKEWLLTRLVESTEEDRQCAGELARKLTNSKDRPVAGSRLQRGATSTPRYVQVLEALKDLHTRYPDHPTTRDLLEEYPELASHWMLSR